MLLSMSQKARHLTFKENMPFVEYSQQKLGFCTCRQNLQTSRQHEYAVHAEEKVTTAKLGIALSGSKMHAAWYLSCLPCECEREACIFYYELQNHSTLSAHGSAVQHRSLQQHCMDSVASACCNVSVPDLHDLMIHT